MKPTPEMTLRQYVDSLCYINRFTYGNREKEELELDREEFKEFYKNNKELVDKLEKERIRNNEFSFDGDLSVEKLEVLFSPENLPYIKNGDQYTPSGFALHTLTYDELFYKFEPFVVDDYTFSYVDRYGGEGMGDSFYVIFKVSRDGVDRYFKWDGWYSSYEGCNPESFYEVVPKEVMAIEYVKLGE